MELTRREELILLFAGEQDEGVWLTEPCYTVPLAVAIAREVRPASEIALRQAIFGSAWPEDLISDEARGFIKLGFERFWQSRGNRGL